MEILMDEKYCSINEILSDSTSKAIFSNWTNGEAAAELAQQHVK